MLDNYDLRVIIALLRKFGHTGEVNYMEKKELNEHEQEYEMELRDIGGEYQMVFCLNDGVITRFEITSDHRGETS